MSDDSKTFVEQRYDYDVVLFEGPTPVRARRIAQTIALVEFAICLAFIVNDRQVVLFALGAVFSAQSFALTARMKSFAGPPSQDDVLQARIAPILKELCIGARCQIPRVHLTRTTMPLAVMYHKGSVSLLVSPDVMDALDDRALRAVLAHEVTHLARGDVGAIRRRWQLSLIGMYLVGAILAGVIAHNSWTAYALVIILLVPCVRLIGLALSFQNRPRENRADIEGASAVGDPEGMIRGLRVVYELSDTAREQFYTRGLWKWALFPWSIRPRSHPTLDQRVARLNALEGSQSGSSRNEPWSGLTGHQ